MGLGVCAGGWGQAGVPPGAAWGLPGAWTRRGAARPNGEGALGVRMG